MALQIAYQWGSVSQRISWAAADTTEGVGFGVGIQVVAGSKGIALAYLNASTPYVADGSVQGFGFRVMVLAGQIPSDMTSLQATDDNPVLGFGRPSVNALAVTPKVLFERFYSTQVYANSFTVQPQSSAEETFRHGPRVASGETMSIVLLPMWDPKVTHANGSYLIELNAYGRDLTPGELNDGSYNVRSLPPRNM